MRVAGAIFFCVAVLLAWGCGGNSENEADPSSAESTGTAIVARPSAQSRQGSGSDLLIHPTPRPPDVSAQFNFVGGAGPGACFEVGNLPQIRVLVQPFPTEAESTAEGFNDEGIATYGQPVDVCFDGMGRGPIAVTVDGPGGRRFSGVLPQLPDSSQYHYNGEWSGFDWIPAIEPSWPLGKYMIVARAGAITRRHAMTLVPPHGPGLRVLGPSTDPGHNSVPPDSRAKLFLTGFQGGRSVEVLAYRTTNFEQRPRFFSATSVPLPASGNAVLELPTGSTGGHQGTEPFFIITTRSRGKTLFAPFTVVKERVPFANLVVGPLPPPGVDCHRESREHCARSHKATPP